MSEIFENLTLQVLWNQGDELTPGGVWRRKLLKNGRTEVGDLREISGVMLGGARRPANPMNR